MCISTPDKLQAQFRDRGERWMEYREGKEVQKTQEHVSSNLMPTRKINTNRHISIKTREVLVNLVLDKGYTYLRASKKLRIKLSTAKLIVKRFKERGTFFDPTTKQDIGPQVHPPVHANENSQHDEPRMHIPATTPNFLLENNVLPLLDPVDLNQAAAMVIPMQLSYQDWMSCFFWGMFYRSS